MVSGLPARRAWLAGHMWIWYHMSKSGQFMCKLGTIYPDFSFSFLFSFSLSFSSSSSFSASSLSLSLVLFFSPSFFLSSSHFCSSVFPCSLFLTISFIHVVFLCFSICLAICLSICQLFFWPVAVSCRCLLNLSGRTLSPVGYWIHAVTGG